MIQIWEVVRPGSVLDWMLCIILCRMSRMDVLDRYVPPEGVAGIVLLGVLRILMESGNVQSAIAGSILAGGIMIGCNLLYPGAFGGGDIKLMLAAGIYLGPDRALKAFLTGMVLAAVWTMAGLLLSRLKRKDTIALVPFLSMGIGILLFCN